MTSSSPPCSVTSSAVRANPIPVPSCERPVDATRWKRSTTRGTSDAGMPTPVSSTPKRTSFSRYSTKTRILPSSVYLNALPIMLKQIYGRIDLVVQILWVLMVVQREEKWSHLLPKLGINVCQPLLFLVPLDLEL